MARPRKKIDKEQFEKLCNIQCTLEEIAGWFQCSPDTIENWCKREYNEGFSDIFKVYSANGRISLRRTQFRLAEKSYAMAIWLGKQYLGQRDHVEVAAPGAESAVEQIAKQLMQGSGNAGEM